jgi:hypothetical protein
MVLLGLVLGFEQGLETAMDLETWPGPGLETALEWVLGFILESLEPEMALDWVLGLILETELCLELGTNARHQTRRRTRMVTLPHWMTTNPGLELETWLGTNAKQQTRRPTLTATFPHQTRT